VILLDCPHCSAANPAGSLTCTQCGKELPAATMMTVAGATSDGWARAATSISAGAALNLETGSVLAGRYEILQLLGKGGMGSVFKAQDRELDRLVALKVIRPDLAGDSETLHRFKQELILARQVTHRNVIRIFDLGQDSGVKFITMEFVEGKDLKQLLKEKQKLTAEEAVAIMEQVCLALEEAHEEGVIHRDLKPQNIMVDGQGKVLVMDFGIARSMEGSGATQTGALIGTPEYMSPEQAKGEKVDSRSDLFPVGIMFYELITGTQPYKSDTAMGTLLKRIQERPVPPVALDQTIPKPISRIVEKCLAIERDQRYQTAREILNDIHAWKNPELAVPAGARVPAWLTGPYGLAAAAAVLLAIVGGVYFLARVMAPAGPAPEPKPVTILVADFDNKTSDSVFDGTLESTFTLALEGAPFISSYRRGDARKVANQMKPGTTRLEEGLARLIAVREGISVVVSGSITPNGSGYLVAVKAVDAVSGDVLIEETEKPGSKDQVLAAVTGLATPIRKALGDVTPDSALKAAAETFTAASIDAAHEYAQAQELQWAGKTGEALQSYLKAVELDPDMGRAYAGLAAINANLGRPQEAEKYYQLAMTKIDRMADREKFRTRGGYYLSSRNAEKAIEEYAALVKEFPADSGGRTNLAFAYSLRRDLGRALEEGRKAVEIYPKNLLQRNNLAIYALYASDFETAEREARSVLEANPQFMKAHVVIALSQLAREQPDKAMETYRKMEGISPAAASYATTGLADLALFQGRAADAAALLEPAVESDIGVKSMTAAAIKLVMLAEARLLLGQKGPALAAADRAAALSQEETLQFSLARVYLDGGQKGKASQMAERLSQSFLTEAQVYGKLIEGETLLNDGDARGAGKVFLEAQKALDTWIGRVFLARALIEAGAFTEAYSELDACLKRRGEATAEYLDEVPSYRRFPQVYYFIGRAQEGLKSESGPDSYRAFLDLKKDGGKDPLVEDARRRLKNR